MSRGKNNNKSKTESKDCSVNDFCFSTEFPRGMSCCLSSFRTLFQNPPQTSLYCLHGKLWCCSVMICYYPSLSDPSPQTSFFHNLPGEGGEDTTQDCGAQLLKSTDNKAFIYTYLIITMLCRGFPRHFLPSVIVTVVSGCGVFLFSFWLFVLMENQKHKQS